MRSRRAIIALQIALGVALVVFVGVEVRSGWSEIRPRLADIAYVHVALAVAGLAVYYGLFVIGWMLVLRAFGMRIGYVDALGAEMLSMLAKYIPGGVWTPMARVVACRPLGFAPGPVLASIGYEAGLSAIAGVVVFVLSLPLVPEVDMPVPVPVLVGFAVLLVVLLHPAIFGRVADKAFGRFQDEPIPRLPIRAALPVFAYYCGTWLVGGYAVLEMIRAVGDAPLSAIPYLGGASAVGAIVAVLVVFAPSGLGVREGAMYALILAFCDPATALVVVALNRLLLTAVEAALLGVVLLLRRFRSGPAPLVEEAV
jgi:uncharacterized membrane protein YbhN (UPF0104 family)